MNLGPKTFQNKDRRENPEHQKENVKSSTSQTDGLTGTGWLISNFRKKKEVGDFRAGDELET